MSQQQQHEPSLAHARDEILQAIDLDGRVREVEVQQAVTSSALGDVQRQVTNVRDELRASRQEAKDTRLEILQAIEAAKPKVWPAVSGVVAAIALILLIAQNLYGA